MDHIECMNLSVSASFSTSLYAFPAEVDVLVHGLVAVALEVGVAHAHVTALHARRVTRLTVHGLEDKIKSLN